VPRQISTIAYIWVRVNQHATFVDESIVELRNVLTFAHQQSLPDILLFAYTALLLLLVGMGRIEEALRNTSRKKRLRMRNLLT
jgi:hypothetical protein